MGATTCSDQLNLHNTVTHWGDVTDWESHFCSNFAKFYQQGIYKFLIIAL